MQSWEAPSRLVGTHIHALDAVSRSKTVWHIDAQDVAAIGHLFRTGTLDVSRVISLGGPMVKNPRLSRRASAQCRHLTGEAEERLSRAQCSRALPWA